MIIPVIVQIAGGASAYAATEAAKVILKNLVLEEGQKVMIKIGTGLIAYAVGTKVGHVVTSELETVIDLAKLSMAKIRAQKYKEE